MEPEAAAGHQGVRRVVVFRRRLFRWSAWVAYYSIALAVVVEFDHLYIERYGQVWAGVATVGLIAAFAGPLVFIGEKPTLTRGERAARMCGIIVMCFLLSIFGKPSSDVVNLATLLLLANASVGVLGLLSCLVWTSLDKVGQKGSGSAGYAGDTRQGGDRAAMGLDRSGGDQPG